MTSLARDLASHLREQGSLVVPAAEREAFVAELFEQP